eukprot:3157031-Rhodomonas_salina.2
MATRTGEYIANLNAAKHNKNKTTDTFKTTRKRSTRRSSAKRKRPRNNTLESGSTAIVGHEDVAESDDVLDRFVDGQDAWSEEGWFEAQQVDVGHSPAFGAAGTPQ